MRVLFGLSCILIAAALARRDFLGDGVRHLPAVLSNQPQFGEPRWLLFPPLGWFWIKLLAFTGLTQGSEPALQALLWPCVASGILFLFSLRSWLRAECGDETRRAAALLLAGNCAPFLILFSDMAEPQIAAGIVACGLAYARVRRDDADRAGGAAIVAISVIAGAALIYQGVILALGMVPLVVSSKTMRSRRVLAATGAALLLVPAAMVAAQTAAGTTCTVAIATTFGGERNPLARSFMARPSAAKYVVALVAGPPQGIVALDHFGGIPALLSSLRSSNAATAWSATQNVCRLLLGCVVIGILLVNGVRDRRWPLMASAAVLLALPVLRNQQYAYPKFFILWPIPVALLALGGRTRTIAAAALLVLVSNSWLVAQDIRRGRQTYAAVHEAYGKATPSTCWVTSGWAAPVPYLWPGTTTTILGTLATGSQPPLQASALTSSLQRCFCEADSVWTDTTVLDTPIVTSLARHFDYTSIDLASVLANPSESTERLTTPAVRVYSDAAQQRICRVLTTSSRH